MSERQTYAVVVNEDVDGQGVDEILALLRRFNVETRARDDASPFVECHVGRMEKRVSGTHSWWDVGRAMEWRVKKNAEVVFATQTSNRDAGAAFLHHAGLKWIAAQDLGSVERVNGIVRDVKAVQIDSSANESANVPHRRDECPARDLFDENAVQEVFKRIKNCRGHWRDDGHGQQRGTCDKKKKVRKTNIRENREGVRPQGEHSTAGCSGR